MCDAAGVTLGMRGEGNAGNTTTGDGAHPEPTPAAAGRGNTPVTLVLMRPVLWVTMAGAENAKQDNDFPQALPPLPADSDASDGAAHAHALLGDTFARIAGWWVEGAAVRRPRRAGGALAVSEQASLSRVAACGSSGYGGATKRAISGGVSRSGPRKCLVPLGDSRSAPLRAGLIGAGAGDVGIGTASRRGRTCAPAARSAGSRRTAVRPMRG